jgi:hypothetical protein
LYTFANRMHLSGVVKECETHLASKWFQGPEPGSCCKLWDKTLTSRRPTNLREYPSILDEMSAPMLRSLLLAVGKFGQSIVAGKYSTTPTPFRAEWPEEVFPPLLQDY